MGCQRKARNIFCQEIATVNVRAEVGIGVVRYTSTSTLIPKTLIIADSVHIESGSGGTCIIRVFRSDEWGRRGKRRILCR